jgi:hypothetical protein
LVLGPLTIMRFTNSRLDPNNYVEGPLSVKPATRLRQMLARPGIVVSPLLMTEIQFLFVGI